MDRRSFLSMLAISPVVAKESLKKDTDIYITGQERDIFISTRKKIRDLRRHIGYGNFNIIAFDDALKIMRRAYKLKPFNKQELEFIEKMFYEDPKKYGFYGKRTCDHLTTRINKKDVYKVPYTGHYLYKGKPLNDYKKLKKDVGDELVLTSGVRGILKQMDLHFAKIHRLNFNISEASTYLAPPGYSYHSVSDFDVGKKGFGLYNFTARFATTKEFRKLKNLDYVSIRYTLNNSDGVRYEPWHIQVI